MLSLASETEPAWADRAVAHLDELLLDHAHCEKKAAGSAVNLLFRYPEHPFLLAPLSRLAREELVHFEAVLREIEARGGRFARQKPSPYGGKLHRCLRSREPERLLDWLLVCALIEARSCERFALLAKAAPPPLDALYRGLLASEARHHGSFLGLARQLAPPEASRERLAELASREAEILAEPCGLVRLHT